MGLQWAPPPPHHHHHPGGCRSLRTALLAGPLDLVQLWFTGRLRAAAPEHRQTHTLVRSWAHRSPMGTTSVPVCAPHMWLLVFSRYSERSWKRLHLLGRGADWNRCHRLQTQQVSQPRIALSLTVRLAPALLDLPFLWLSGGLFYAVFKELFSSSSPNKIYGKALEKCRTHPEVSRQDWVAQTLILGRKHWGVGRIPLPVPRGVSSPDNGRFVITASALLNLNCPDYEHPQLRVGALSSLTVWESRLTSCPRK